MATNEEIENQEPLESPDEAALNEEASRELAAMVAEVEAATGAESESEEEEDPNVAPQSQAERSGIIEALIFVSDEPLTLKTIAGVLKEEKALVEESVKALAEEFNARNGGLATA